MRQSDYNKFKLSKPWGYFPPDVDRAIDEYESALGKLNARMSESMMENQRLKGIITRLEDELRALHVEMSSIELPDTEEIQETVVLQEFRQYPNNMSPPVPAGMDQHQDEGGVVDMVDDQSDSFDGNIQQALQLEEGDEEEGISAPVGMQQPRRPNLKMSAPQSPQRKMKLGLQQQAAAQPEQTDEESEGMSDLLLSLEQQAPKRGEHADDLPQHLDPSQIPGLDDEPFDGIQGRVRMKREAPHIPTQPDGSQQGDDDESEGCFNIVM